ncbi:DJ-1/PfpI family protein [Candidatus Bipolaricaulota bacterium]
MRRVGCLVAVAIAIATLSLVLGFASPETSRVVIFLPPETAMGQEFVQLIAVFDAEGVDYDVVAAELGPYLFWEDSGEGAKASPDFPRGYEWEIRKTFDDIDMADYDVLIMGPGFGHTVWAGESLPKAEALLQEAYDAGMPIGGVSFGAMFLIQNGYLDGRTAARPPLYQGVVSEERHRTLFLSTFDAIYGMQCIHVDYGVGGISTIITANYRCVTGFARRIISMFLAED